MNSTGIPTYAADGRRLRNSSESTILWLLERDHVVVERSRKGKIRCAHFRPVGGANPIRKNAHMGQHYSYAEHVNEFLVWKHRDELGNGDIEALFGELTPEELRRRDLFVRAIFRAVPLSVMRRQPPSRTAPALLNHELPATEIPPMLANVVSIDSGRRKFTRKFTQRPIEFDSERRAA